MITTVLKQKINIFLSSFRLEKERAERENEMFPDEIDTPFDVPARVRFQKWVCVAFILVDLNTEESRKRMMFVALDTEDSRVLELLHGIQRKI